MALLPPSVLRRNPLVGWEDRSGLTAKQAREPFATLLQPEVAAKYEKVYTKVGLPLAVVIRKYPDWRNDPKWTEAMREDEVYAKRLNAIVLRVLVPERESTPFYHRGDQARGSSSRISPYTPFVLLHRLGDDLRATNIPECEHLKRALGRAEDTYEGNMSRGVDTAAGRMGVIHGDYLSDLWAKWLLTGRLAYSATNPPPQRDDENEDDPEAEATLRNMVAEYAPQIFRIWYKYLMVNKPMVIDI